jgi:hypothetical protein
LPKISAKSLRQKSLAKFSAPEPAGIYRDFYLECKRFLASIKRFLEFQSSGTGIRSLIVVQQELSRI